MIELGKAHSKPSDLALPALVVPDANIVTAEAVNAFDAQWIEKWNNVSGDVAVFDMNWNYSNAVNGVFNQERNWDGQATMEVEHAGKPIIGARYWFAPIGYPNGHKKTRYLDLYYWDGYAWIFHVTWNTAYPSALSVEDLDLAGNPMPNPTGRIRIRGRDNWGNVGGSFSYRWVAECTVRVLG